MVSKFFHVYAPRHTLQKPATEIGAINLTPDSGAKCRPMAPISGAGFWNVCQGALSSSNRAECATSGGDGRAVEMRDATRAWLTLRKQTSKFTQRHERQTGNRRRKAASLAAATSSRTESRPSAHRISLFNVL